MYPIAALALFILINTPDSRAASQEIAFSTIQTECVHTAKMPTDLAAPSSSCHITKGRWFSTIEHDDFYQAQYCLQATNDAKNCQRRALLLFANRAYTPTARLTLERIDPAETTYDDPQVYVTAAGHIMKLTVRLPQDNAQVSYYRWTNESWEPIATTSGGDIRDLIPVEH